MRCTVLLLLQSLYPRRKRTGTSVSSLSPLRSKGRSVTCQKKKDCDGYIIFSPFGLLCDDCLWRLTTCEPWVLVCLKPESFSWLRCELFWGKNDYTIILTWLMCGFDFESMLSCVCVCGGTSMKMNGNLQKAWIKTSGCNAYIYLMSVFKCFSLLEIYGFRDCIQNLKEFAHDFFLILSYYTFFFFL